MLKTLKSFVVFITSLVLLSNIVVTHARPIFVSDYAHVINFDSKWVLRDIMTPIMDNFGLHLDFILFANFLGKNPEGLMDFFYTQLSIRSPQTAGKAVLLISLDDLYVNIRVSENAETILTKEVQQEIRNIAANHLKAERYNQMLIEPAQKIYQTFDPSYRAAPLPQEGNNLALIAIVFILLVGGGAGYYLFTSRKK